MSTDTNNAAAANVAEAAPAKQDVVVTVRGKRNWKRIALISGAGIAAAAGVGLAVMTLVKKPEAAAAVADAVSAS